MIIKIRERFIFNCANVLVRVFIGIVVLIFFINWNILSNEQLYFIRIPLCIWLIEGIIDIFEKVEEKELEEK